MPAFAELPAPGSIPIWLKPTEVVKDIVNWSAGKSETVESTIERNYGSAQQKVESLQVAWETNPERLVDDIDKTLYLLDILPDRMQQLNPTQELIDEFRSAYQWFSMDLATSLEGDPHVGNMSVRNKTTAQGIETDDVAAVIATVDNLYAETYQHPAPLRVLAKHSQALCRIAEAAVTESRESLELRNRIVGELTSLQIHGLAFEALVDKQTRPLRMTPEEFAWYQKEQEVLQPVVEHIEPVQSNPDQEVEKSQRTILGENQKRLQLAEALDSGRQQIQKYMVMELLKQKEAEQPLKPSYAAAHSAIRYFLNDVMTLDRGGILDTEDFEAQNVPVADRLNSHPRIKTWLQQTNSIVTPDNEDRQATLNKMTASQKAELILELGPNSQNIAVLETALQRAKSETGLNSDETEKMISMLCYADLYLSLHPESFGEMSSYPDTQSLRSLQNLGLYIENSPGALEKNFNRIQVTADVNVRTNIILNAVQEMIGGKEEVIYTPQNSTDTVTVQVAGNPDVVLVGDGLFPETGAPNEVPAALLEPQNFTGADIIGYAYDSYSPSSANAHQKPATKPKDPFVLGRAEYIVENI